MARLRGKIVGDWHKCPSSLLFPAQSCAAPGGPAVSVLVCRFAQVALLTVALCPSLAEASPTTSVVLSPPASRVVLSACSLVVAPNGNASVTFSATNEHPKLALERVRVVLRVKNDLDQKIGQFTLASEGMGADQGETATYDKPLYELNYSRAMATRSATCTLSAATLAGGSCVDVGQGLEGTEVAFSAGHAE